MDDPKGKRRPRAPFCVVGNRCGVLQASALIAVDRRDFVRETMFL